MTRELTEADFQALADEAERGYCTHYVGVAVTAGDGKQYLKFCLKPAVAEINTPDGGPGLACAEHVQGWAKSVTRMLD
jgi:hypothetical protein